MPRTRDYLLMISTVAFLLVAIFATAHNPSVSGSSMPAVAFGALTEDEALSEAFLNEKTPDRLGRLEYFKQKIAGINNIDLNTNEPDKETKTPVTAVVDEEAMPAENRCVGYRQVNTAWNPVGIIIDEVEGARLVYRNLVTASPITGTTTADFVMPILTKDILLQLPMASIPTGQPSCVSTNVVGVATNGGLIENSDVSLYLNTGNDTLVGYALDGFPIYGLSEGQTDACGGYIKNGQYRYQLSAKRETIINCFAGMPVSL